MIEESKGYNLQGLRLVGTGEYIKAVDFFSKAIELDPHFLEAYKNRGETLILLDRFVEGNKDIQKAKGGKVSKRKASKKERTVNKLNMREIDNVYDAIFYDESFPVDGDALDPDNSLYDYDYTDDTIEGEEPFQEVVQRPPEVATYPAILEYIGGRQQKVPYATLFKPWKDSLLIVEEEGGPEKVISFDQLVCIKFSSKPEHFSDKQKESCVLEVIETVDGKSYQELVHSEQNVDNLLVSFSAKEQSTYFFILFPKSNIKKRCQEKLLIDILVEKHLIGKDILKKINEEYHDIKSLKIGKIIASKSRVPSSSIEAELVKAKTNQLAGLRTGEILVASGLVNERQVLQALEYQEHLRNLKIGQFLIEKGIVQEKEIYISLAEKHRIPFVDLRKQKISKQSITNLPNKMVLDHEILPIAMKAGTIVVATHFVDMTHLSEKILKVAKCQQVMYVLSTPTQIRNIIHLLYSKTVNRKDADEISNIENVQLQTPREPKVKQDQTLQIVNICYRLELIAHQTYFLLSTLTDNVEMHEFWLKMSEEENSHILFWRKLKKFAEKWPLPDVFDNPDQIISELEALTPKIQELIKRCKKDKDLISSITLAYRLEFYLLHPALEVLFNFVGATSGPNPKDKYEDHINNLINMLSKVAETTPALELLGETLQRLWQDNQKLAHEVATDSLTNMLNRRGFFNLATHMSYLANRQSSIVGIMMLDIDDFKKVNDTYGHHVGDIVLEKVAQVIGATSRGSDIVGRYGGEEFCIFMPDVEPHTIEQVAERVRLAIYQSKPNSLQVTISIGVVYGKVSANAPEDLRTMIQQADENLYEAKKQGKNRVIMTKRNELLIS